MEKHYDQHISRQFNQELEELRHSMMNMGGLVESMVSDVITALVEADTELAARVIETDDRVNQLEKKIDSECNLIIARRQPTASDLRLVFAIIKAISDLERIGDEAEKIARFTIDLATYERPRNNYRELALMGQDVIGMLRKGLDGFIRLAPEVAVEIFREDKKVDEDYETIFRQYYSYMMEDARSIRRVLDALLVAKALERIGDHCKNLGEYTVYVAEGLDLRHQPTSEYEKRLHPDG
ncbi:MAG: phosphate signaling complex protein PhoU [Wenzhouxiangellaceae bacterium]